MIMLDPEISNVSGLVDTFLLWQNENGPPRGHEIYHPSAFGKCLRLMQYQRYEERGWVHAEKEQHDPSLLRTFGNGHAMHDRWRSYFEALDILKGVWHCGNPLCRMYNDDGHFGALKDENGKPIVNLPEATAVIAANPKQYTPRVHGEEHLQGIFKPEKCNCGWREFRYDEVLVEDKELNFKGHCDIILDFEHFNPDKWKGVKQLYVPELLPKKPVVVDMKTINHFSYKAVADGTPHEYYRIQLQVYANVLDCEYGILIYENKNNMATTAFRIERAAKERWPIIREQALLMNEAADMTDEYGKPLMLLPPPRPDSPDSKDCKYCNFSSICHESPIWSDPQLNEKRQAFYGDLL